MGRRRATSPSVTPPGGVAVALLSVAAHFFRPFVQVEYLTCDAALIVFVHTLNDELPMTIGAEIVQDIAQRFMEIRPRQAVRGQLMQPVDIGIAKALRERPGPRRKPAGDTT